VADANNDVMAWRQLESRQPAMSYFNESRTGKWQPDGQASKPTMTSDQPMTMTMTNNKAGQA